MRSLRNRLTKMFADNRALVGKLMLELIVIFVGVSAAFALETVRRDREEAEYYATIIAALVPTLDNAIEHNREFEREVGPKLIAFDAAIARGEQPSLPIFRISDGERPPIRIWDSVVATGAARALKPDLLFRLSVFYNRQYSVGERYVRYATYTEQRIFPLGADKAAIYDTQGKLRPEFAAYVDRLRELREAERRVTAQAIVLRGELKRLL